MTPQREAFLRVLGRTQHQLTADELLRGGALLPPVSTHAGQWMSTASFCMDPPR